jgi:hypothetical protein
VCISLTVSDVFANTFVPISNSIEPGYPVQGGIFREEAIMLLRRFYVQQNGKGKFKQDAMIMTDSILSPGANE